PCRPAETARSACAGKQVNIMSKHRHLPHLSLIVGFLMMTASAAARQSNTAGNPFNTGAGPFNTAKPGQSVERHLSDDQKFREWSLDPTVTDNINRDIKRIKVCRVEDVCK